MRMAHSRLIPSVFERTNPKHGTPGPAILLSVGLMLFGTAVLSFGHITGSDMYDLFGSLSVFGFLTAYSLVAIALPFARRARGHHSLLIPAASVLTVAVMVLIALYDLRSTSDATHARIPYIYLVYLAAGIGWSLVRRRNVQTDN